MSNPTSEPWTVGRLLQWTTGYLQTHGSDSPRLDAEVLLAHALGCRRIELYTTFEEVPCESARDVFRVLVRRRAEGTPVAYLVGRREFYSLDFRVTPDVLVPRPETELLVVAALDLARGRGSEVRGQGAGTSGQRPVVSGQRVASGEWRVASEDAPDLPSPACGRGAGGEGNQPHSQPALTLALSGHHEVVVERGQTFASRIPESPNPEPPLPAPRPQPPCSIADVGTGSGCIAVALAKHLPDCRVTAIDISPAALAIARENAEKHGVAQRIEFIAGDLLAAVPSERRFDIIVSNPPYVADGEWAALPADVREHEPRGALLAGPRGTEVIERLIPQAAQRLVPGGHLLMEISPAIHEAVCELLRSDGHFELGPTIKDLARRPRVVQATLEKGTLLIPANQ
jgi:release factor glutamine methyltransferase